MAKRKWKKQKRLFKCYMCDKASSGREHVPPRSFFPEDRVGLVHVPSCAIHNEGNAKDVEYIRNIIVSSYSTNEVARSLSPKVIRSLKRSPGLLKTTLQNQHQVVLEGKQTAAFDLDLNRLKKVMNAVAHALYYREFGKTYPYKWEILCPSLFSMELEMKGLADPIAAEMRRLVSSIPVTDKDTNHPDIFKYAAYTESNKLFAYKLTFYEGFFIYAIGITPNGTTPDDQP